MEGKRRGKDFDKKKAEAAKEAARKVHYDEAMGHLKGGGYEKALAAFNTALELSPNDKTALVARSKCYLLLGNAQQALEDAETALSIDKAYIKALFQKAEALYHLGDFEHSLMYYHRGLRARPEMECFRLGVQKAQEAIENVIGNNKCPFPTSPRMLKALFASTKGGGDSSRFTAGTQKTMSTPSDQKAKPQVPKASERRLLGDLYEDKLYLEKLLKNPEIISLNQEFANNDVMGHAEEGIAFLKARQEFWRQQKPNVAINQSLKKERGLKNNKKNNKVH